MIVIQSIFQSAGQEREVKVSEDVCALEALKAYRKSTLACPY